MRGRKLGAGKQRRAPHQDFFSFYESLSGSPAPVCDQISQSVALLLTVKHQLWSEPPHSVCVFYQCPWTSLACVLIKSLLVIPRGARWDSSHVIPPPRSVSGSFPRFLSSSTCPLNFPQSQARHQSSDGELLFLFSRWSAGALVCRCEADKGETIKVDFAISLSDVCHISVRHVSLCNFLNSSMLDVRRICSVARNSLSFVFVNMTISLFSHYQNLTINFKSFLRLVLLPFCSSSAMLFFLNFY